MNAQDRTMALLAILAEQSGENVSQTRLEFMARKLLDFDQQQVGAALEKLLESCRRFPTLAEVKAAMGLEEITDGDKAREVAERIYTAIGKFHSLNGCYDYHELKAVGWKEEICRKNKWQKICDFIGPIGEKVVELQGGWNRVCDGAREGNAGMLKAQWRELAIVVQKKVKRGNFEEPPTFDALPAANAAPLIEDRQ